MTRTAPPAPDTDLRVCFVGDSFTQGVGDPDHLGWVGRVCAAWHGAGQPLTGYNLGVRGETSTQIARRWHHECAWRLNTGTDRRVVFSFGANDTRLEGGKPRVAMAATLANLEAIVVTARREFGTCVIGPAPVADADHNERILVLCDALAGRAAALGVPYLPVAAALISDGTWVREAGAGDGAHPGRAGYAALAARVLQWPDSGFVRT